MGIPHQISKYGFLFSEGLFCSLQSQERLKSNTGKGEWEVKAVTEIGKKNHKFLGLELSANMANALPRENWDRGRHQPGLTTVIVEIFVRVKISYSSVTQLSYATNFRTATVVSHALIYVHGFRMQLNFVLSAKSTKYTKLNRVRKFLRLQYGFLVRGAQWRPWLVHPPPPPIHTHTHTHG